MYQRAVCALGCWLLLVSAAAAAGGPLVRALSKPSLFEVPAHRTDASALQRVLAKHFRALAPHLVEVVRDCPRPADLAPLKAGLSPYVLPSSQHAGPHLVRKAVRDRLLVAGEIAHALGGYRIAVGVGRRTLRQQAQLWNWRLLERFASLLGSRKKARPEELARLARPNGEVANPRRYGCGSPHITGGAVDVLLLDPRGRTVVGFDRRFFYGSKRDYRRRFLDAESDDARHARLLEEAMHAAGFVRYCREGWHFETAATQLYRSWRARGTPGRCFGAGAGGTWDPRREPAVAHATEVSLGEMAELE
jgi:hypothetical protein